MRAKSIHTGSLDYPHRRDDMCQIELGSVGLRIEFSDRQKLTDHSLALTRSEARRSKQMPDPRCVHAHTR